MNLHEANAAWDSFSSQLVVLSRGPSEEMVKFYSANFPREAVDFLTQVGGVALSVYYVAIAYVLYKVISRRRYLHRFLISLAVFAIAALAAIITCGADILHLGNALSFGRKGGDFVALGGFLFASFYRSPTQNQEA